MTDKYKRAVYASNRDSVANEFFPHRRFVFCGGETTFNYAVDPDGDLYNCLVHMGTKEHKTGHILKPFMITSERAKWLFTEMPEQCEKCAYMPQCMCGCTLYRLNEGDTPQCFSSFYTFKNTLKLAYEDYVAQMQKAKA